MQETFRVKDLSGFVFGRLTVLSKSGVDKFGKTEWLCSCECGGIKIVKRDLLIKGSTKSCGCLYRDVMKDFDYSKRTAKTAEKHGMTKTKFYKIWTGIKERCLGDDVLKTKRYKVLEIGMCQEWATSFINFKNDMYSSYLVHVKEFGEKNTSIDRINVLKGYSKENCRWATMEEQNTNRTDSKYFRAISPNCNEYISNNQQKFSRDNGLQASKINSCLKGTRKHHFNWTFQYLTDEEVESYLEANNNNIKGVG